MSNNNNQNELVINMILADIEEIKRDVKELLALKWQIFGAVTTISVLVSIFVGILSK